MPCPHNEISIVQRSHRQSAVAAAAYQSGEKLFCEYDQEVKHYPEKRGIVHNEILLPANAPLEYTDRNTLWNAAEAVEKQWNSQLARRWVLSIPREIPPDQYAALVRDFCRQQFVSKGMCVDFAIHDKGDGNPHAHVMLTMRAMDERGKWLPKSRKVYELDKNGERIKLPSGRWKSHKEDTVDWNDRKYGEIWRHEWEVIQNRYLEANNRPERVDLRSYERQGLDIIPTVHEGAAVRQMEKRGIQTNIGNLNREIKAANSLMKSIRQLIKNLKGWIAELSEKRNELLAQKAAEEAVFLPNLLMKYMEIRKAERSSWTRAGQSRGTSKDLKAVSEALSYLQRKGLSTVEDLDKLPDGLHQTVGGSDFPVQISDIRLDTTLFHLPDSRPLMDSGDNIKPLSGIGTQVHTLRAVIGVQIAVLDNLPFMPPDFTILLVVPVHRILLVAFPPAGRQLYPFPILVKVINLAALGKPFSMFIHCPHGQQDMGVGVVSRRVGVMDGKVNNHAFGNKLLLTKLPDEDSVLVGRYLSWDGKHPPPCKLGVPLFFHRFGGVP